MRISRIGLVHLLITAALVFSNRVCKVLLWYRDAFHNLTSLSGMRRFCYSTLSIYTSKVTVDIITYVKLKPIVFQTDNRKDVYQSATLHPPFDCASYPHVC